MLLTRLQSLYKLGAGQDSTQLCFLRLSRLAESVVWQRRSPRTRACVQSWASRSRVLASAQFVKALQSSEQHLFI